MRIVKLSLIPKRNNPRLGKEGIVGIGDITLTLQGINKIQQGAVDAPDSIITDKAMRPQPTGQLYGSNGGYLLNFIHSSPS